MEYTCVGKAWATYPDQLILREIADGKITAEGVLGITLVSPDLNMETAGWVCVGSARIIFTPCPREEIISAELAVLEEALRLERVKSQDRQNAILQKMRELQALPAPREENQS